MTKPDRKPIDWEAIEREYRAGQLSVSEIGRINAVSHTAINKRAKKDRWSRNLVARVKAEVSARLVSEEVSGKTARETVDAAATRVVDLVRGHRKDIAGLISRCRVLMERYDALTTPDAIGTLDNVSQAASILESVSRLMGRAVQLERQAFNIEGDVPTADDSNDDPRASIQRKLARLAERTGPVGVSG